MKKWDTDLRDDDGFSQIFLWPQMHRIEIDGEELEMEYGTRKIGRGVYG